MKAQLDCVPCLFRQALNTARVASADPALHREVLRRLALHLTAHRGLDRTPAALSRPVYEIVAELTGNPDPYAAIKRANNAAALALLPSVRRRVESAPDPLDAALRAAAAGNMIDLGIGHAFDLARDMARLMETPFALDARAPFRKALARKPALLYLGDNAGEIVFDRLLVEQLLRAGCRVTFCVKSAPIINDALREDARQAGLTDLVPVIETGAGDIGVNWDHVGDAFLRAVAEADLIIAKGHGNFETCDERPEPFFFLLKAKCEVVARALGVRLGDLVFAHRSVRPSPTTSGTVHGASTKSDPQPGSTSP